MAETTAADRTALRASLQERLGCAHWRQRPATDEELACLREEARHEQARFERILEQANDKGVPLPDLFLLASRLENPKLGDEFVQEALRRYNRALEAGAAPSLGPQAAGQDNPAWITLTLPERGKLPSVLRFDETDKSKDDKAEEHRGLFGLVIRLLQRLTGQKSAPPPPVRLRHMAETHSRQGREASAGRQGSEPRLPAKPGPLWGFVRMLLLGAALALIFHFLSRRGLVPKFF